MYVWLCVSVRVETQWATSGLLKLRFVSAKIQSGKGDGRSRMCAAPPPGCIRLGRRFGRHGALCTGAVSATEESDPGKEGPKELLV